MVNAPYIQRAYQAFYFCCYHGRQLGESGVDDNHDETEGLTGRSIRDEELLIFNPYITPKSFWNRKMDRNDAESSDSIAGGQNNNQQDQQDKKDEENNDDSSDKNRDSSDKNNDIIEMVGATEIVAGEQSHHDDDIDRSVEDEESV